MVAVDQAITTVPVEVAPDIIPTEEHAEVQIMSGLGAGKHTSAGIMAAVDTPVVMVVGAAEEKAEGEKESREKQVLAREMQELLDEAEEAASYENYQNTG